MREHPSHNVSGSIFRCYGCGRVTGDPLLAEECPTPDDVGRCQVELVRRMAHRAIYDEFGRTENTICRTDEGWV